MCGMFVLLNIWHWMAHTIVVQTYFLFHNYKMPTSANFFSFLALFLGTTAGLRETLFVRFNTLQFALATGNFVKYWPTNN